jgi:hypothetical protein
MAGGRLNTKRRARATRLAIAAALFALAAGCDTNTSTTLLAPSGTPPRPPSNDRLVGRIEFGTGTYPASLVLVAPVTTGLPSGFRSIGLSGTLVSAGFTPSAAPKLTQLANGYWIDTLTILAGSVEWKFTTNENFDEDPDYGKPGAPPSGGDGLIGTCVRDVPGPDGNIAANVTASQAGLVVCNLDEGPEPKPYALRRIRKGVPAAFTSAADGSFQIDSLVPGRYNILIRTPGTTLRDTILASVFVSGVTDLGVIDLAGPAPVGGLTGKVDWATLGYSDLTAAPFPPTTVILRQGTTGVDTVVTGGGSDSFSFSNLQPGIYDLFLDARMFVARTVTALDVPPGPATDAGTIALTRTNAEASNGLTLVGSFNDPATLHPDSLDWQLGQFPLGVWTLTSPISIPAGVQTFKIVTDYAFSVPPDYGGDPAVTLAVPLANAPVTLVTGSGGSLKVDFPSTGVYNFTLDERRQTLGIQPGPGPLRVKPRRR